MRAFQIEEPGRTRMIEIAEPSPGPGEVRLRVAVLGLCGTDLNTFRGRNPLVSYPRIPGHELSGIVEESGPGVPESLAPGSRVCVIPYSPCGRCSACRLGRRNACRNMRTLGVQCEGAATARIVVAAERLHVRDALSLADLALVEPLAVGFHAAARGRIASGETVVVFGCGMVGLGAIAGAARRGGRVVAVDVDDRKLELAGRAGASQGVNSQALDLHEALQELTDGEGPVVAIEAVGAPSTFRAVVDEVAFAGRVVFIGYTAEDVACRTKYFVQKELDLLGSRNSTRDDFEAVSAMLAEDSGFPRDALVSRVVALEEAGAALAEWSADPARVTKIHVDLQGDEKR
jgi:threonine dehydrogenase-like Zn-dependent dehydrogenase